MLSYAIQNRGKMYAEISHAVEDWGIFINKGKFKKS